MVFQFSLNRVKCCVVHSTPQFSYRLNSAAMEGLNSVSYVQGHACVYICYSKISHWDTSKTKYWDQHVNRVKSEECGPRTLIMIGLDAKCEFRLLSHSLCYICFCFYCFLGDGVSLNAYKDNGRYTCDRLL